ncbi:MAG: radical SAM/SPASM domain-containing protein [Thermodesulfovibrionales bacterium]|jgi:radical SAM protein with 4Fe4S-binding SPASM domain
MIPPVPAYIQLFPTLRCNSSCGFCFNRGLSPTAQMELREFQRITDTISSLDISNLDILGGEPTIWPDLIPALDHAVSARLRVSMSTNGSRVPVLKELSSRFSREALSIGISINSAEISPDLHAYIMEQHPVIKTVSDRDSLVADAALQYLELPELTYYLIYRDALSEAELGDVMPFPHYLRRLKELQSVHANVDGVHCGFIMDRENPLLKDVRCPAGVTKLSVMPDGSAYPCYLLARHGEFCLGNMLQDDFERIWRNPVLRFFREFRGNECPSKSCGIYSYCHGGCPAISLIIHGNIKAPDPRCIDKRGS